jgi:putative pyruvate formate lyase activating enzyme
MPKQEMRLFISKDGMMVVEDPSPLEMAILNRLGIRLHENICSNSRPSPKYKLLRDYRIPLSLDRGQKRLLAIHNEEVRKALSGEDPVFDSNYNLFNLKRSLLKGFLKRCCLCGYRCKGERILSGECPIGRPSYYYQHFIHIGEEREIGRTLVIELTGCNMRCRFCQKGELINPEDIKINPFTPTLWDNLKMDYQQGEFNSISFLGGNPDQSLLAVLDFLKHAPDWSSHLSIVWHTNGYSSPELYMLLWGLVDIWVFDFKYFDDRCAITLSQTPNYKATAKSALETICNMETLSSVIVRHLLLPGHWDCCQKPLIEYLSKYLKNRIIFHPMKQYLPLWRITPGDGEMNRRITTKELRQVLDYTYKSGLIVTSLDWPEIQGEGKCTRL